MTDQTKVENGVIWHAPQPGPDYWNWRCLRCSEPVDRHAAWWRRLWRRITTLPAGPEVPDAE